MKSPPKKVLLRRRVLAFLVGKKKIHCRRIDGVEINEKPGRIAKEWTKKYSDTVSVKIADAFQIDYNQYTVLYMFNPFNEVILQRFFEKLERELTHSIRLIFLTDNICFSLLKRRSGWNLLHREMIFKVKGLQIAGSPQGGVDLGVYECCR